MPGGRSREELERAQRVREKKARAAEKRAARKRARELRQTSVAAQAASRPLPPVGKVEEDGSYTTATGSMYDPDTGRTRRLNAPPKIQKNIDKTRRELEQTTRGYQAAARPPSRKAISDFFNEAKTSGRRPDIGNLGEGSGLIEDAVSGAGKVAGGVTRAAVESFMQEAYGQTSGPDRGGIQNDPRVRGAGLAAKTALDFQIGPDARKALTGQDFDPAWAVAGGLLGVTPFKGSAGLGKAAAGTRALKYADRVQQLPRARSGFSQKVFENTADWTSRKLANEESAAARAVNKVFRTASAGKRVAKAAGKQREQETFRTQAKMWPHVNALPKQGSVEDHAHFWWAQMPANQRNIGGLRRIKAQLAVSLKSLASGEALATNLRQQEAVRAKIKVAKDFNTRADLIDQLQDLKEFATDIPLRMDDLSKSMAELDRVIMAAPDLDPKVIQAVHALSGDRRGVLTEAGILDDARATEREGIVSRWIGDEATGEEAFIGHRMGQPRGTRTGSGGTGRVRTPEGVGRENKLALAKSGRLIPSTHIAAQDWQAAQVYRGALHDREVLGQLGTAWNGSALPKGTVLINPKGRVFPKAWKTERMGKLADADEEEILKASREITESFIIQGTDVSEMRRAALEAGVEWDELRVVPENLVKRYYGQFSPLGKATIGGQAIDVATDFMAASIIFARMGYIPKNIAQNLIMSIPHQGAFALVNIPRAAQAYAHPALRHLLEAEVAHSGSTIGLADEASGVVGKGVKGVRGIPSKAAGVSGGIADTPLRISALLHEAAAEGVIPKYSAHLSERDIQALTAFLTDPRHRPILNDVRSRSVEAMADFSRLTPKQRRWSRRFLIIPGWLWAGSRYPFHFAATHPGRAAAIGYVAAGAPGQDVVDIPPVTDYFADGLPYYVSGLDVGDNKVLRTTSLNPVSTPWEIAAAITGVSPRTAGSYANPMIAAPWNILNKQIQGPYGTYAAESYQDAAKAAGERLAPNWSLFQDLKSPPQDDPRYPEDASRWGRIKRELGVFPIEITRDKPTGAKAKNKEESDNMLSAIPKFLPAKYRGAATRDLKAAYSRKTALDEQRARIQKDTESGRPYDEATFPAELDLAVQWKLITPKIAAERKKWMATASDEELDEEIRYFRDHVMSAHLETINSIEDALKHYGWEPSGK